jgi:hypothetical protein
LWWWWWGLSVISFILMGAGLEGFCSDMSFVEAVEGDESTLRCFLDCFFFARTRSRPAYHYIKKKKMRENQKKPHHSVRNLTKRETTATHDLKPKQRLR